MKSNFFIGLNLLLMFNLSVASIRRLTGCPVKAISTVLMARQTYVLASIIESNQDDPESKNVVYCLPKELPSCWRNGLSCKVVDPDVTLWKIFCATVLWGKSERSWVKSEPQEYFDLCAPVLADSRSGVCGYIHVCGFSSYSRGLYLADSFDCCFMGERFNKLREALNDIIKNQVDDISIEPSLYFGQYLLPKDVSSLASSRVVNPQLLDPRECFERCGFWR